MSAIVIDLRVDGAMFCIEAHGTRRINRLVKAQGKTVVGVTAVYPRIIPSRRRLIREMIPPLYTRCDKPAHAIIAALIGNFITACSA